MARGRRRPRARKSSRLGTVPSPQKGSNKRKADKRCASCTLMFSNKGLMDLNSPNGFIHHTHDQLRSSKNDGCSLCRHILDAGPWGRDTQLEPDDHLIFRNISSTTSARIERVDTLQGNLEHASDFLRIYLFSKSADPAASFIPRRPLSRDVQSDQVLCAARRLINDCLRPDSPHEGHHQCRFSRDTMLPSRVLDLGDPESPGRKLRLRVNTNDKRGSYLALSYCWGKRDLSINDQPTELRETNLQELTSNIDPENLPRSIQDAVTITRELGYRYLWVDALCILQDKAEDKASEISRMAVIYKNAVITLVAGVAETSSDGFLQRPGHQLAPYLPQTKLKIPMSNGEIGTIYLSFKPYVPDHPLDKRGWALQEFMLSSRMLIFSDYELLWQCKEVPLQSVTGTTRGLEYYQPLESLPWAVFDEDAEPHFGSQDFDKVYLWKTIIHQFTSRDLSDPDDRLAAIMGITSELEKLWQDTNLYGHWAKWFIQLLCWYKLEAETVGKRHLHRAPSWSWASVDDKVHYDQTMEVEDAKLIALTVGEVVLKCRIMDVDDINQDKAPRAVSELPDLDSYGAMKEQQGQECKYLLLGRSRLSQGGERGVGLLVVKTPHGQYRRFGFAIFMDMSIWEGIGPEEIAFEPKQN